MGNEVAMKKSAELSTDFVDDMFEDGAEGAVFAANELQIPYLRLAQQMSPQVNKKDAKYIEGLSSGDVFNTLTEQVYGDGVMLIPCYSKTSYTEWVPRDMGGGRVQEFTADNLPKTERISLGGKTVDQLDNGNELVTSDDHYCLVVDGEGNYEPVLLDMKSTQRKVAKRWRTMITMNKARNPKTNHLQVLPLYSTIWKLTSVDETNKKNETYSNYAIQKVGPLTKDQRELYDEAKAFRESVMAGEVHASEGGQAAAPTEEQVAEDKKRDDEIPF